MTKEMQKHVVEFAKKAQADCALLNPQTNDGQWFYRVFDLSELSPALKVLTGEDCKPRGYNAIQRP